MLNFECQVSLFNLGLTSGSDFLGALFGLSASLCFVGLRLFLTLAGLSSSYVPLVHRDKSTGTSGALFQVHDAGAERRAESTHAKSPSWV